MSSVEPQRLREFDVPQQYAQDLKTLNSLAEGAKSLVTVIGVNIHTIKSMYHAVERLERFPEYAKQNDYVLCDFKRRLDHAKQLHCYHLRNVSSIADRAKSVATQLRDTAALRNSEINRLNALATIELTEKSGSETYIVKALTVLALIFAPASFAAVSNVY